MANSEYGHCDSCGKPLDEDDDFTWRADAIRDALESADSVTRELLLAMFAARYLVEFVPEDIKKARRGLLREIDRETKEAIIRSCDA